MSTTPVAQRRRHWWKLALLLLVVFPFLSEIAIYAVAGLARINGCVVDQKEVCFVAGAKVSDVISRLLTAGLWVAGGFVGFGLAALWLVMCYLLIARGWAGLIVRFSLVLSVTLIFALLPYLAPGLAIAPLINAHCQPNEGGVGPCVIFGGDVSGAHQTIVLPWLLFAGVPIALGTAVIYAIVVTVIRARRARPARPPAQLQQ
jgi:hypothetical protein